ncbi:MAG: BF3164 family lipoprotein [Cyclobacteriaceae bacterium]|nr:BF3164 family lipoprotein [Cyclobacteriaceae bacterium]
MTNITKMIIKDDILIISNNREDSLFMLFSIPDLELLAAFGISGQEPDEFMFPQLVETNEADKLCYIYNPVSESLWSVSRQFEPVVVNNHQLPKTSRKYGDKQLTVFLNGDRYFVETSGNIKNVNLQCADSLVREQVYNLSNEIEGYKNWAAYIGDFGTNEGLSRIVYAYKYFKGLSFVDLKIYQCKTLLFDYDLQSKGKTAIDFLAPSTVTHYWGMWVTSSGVYCGYSGRNSIQVQEEGKKDITYIYIEKFDWQGKRSKNTN